MFGFEGPVYSFLVALDHHIRLVPCILSEALTKSYSALLVSLEHDLEPIQGKFEVLLGVTNAFQRSGNHTSPS
jgi:hypothetical protein